MSKGGGEGAEVRVPGSGNSQGKGPQVFEEHQGGQGGWSRVSKGERNRGRELGRHGEE